MGRVSRVRPCKQNGEVENFECCFVRILERDYENIVVAAVDSDGGIIKYCVGNQIFEGESCSPSTICNVHIFTVHLQRANVNKDWG